MCMTVLTTAGALPNDVEASEVIPQESRQTRLLRRETVTRSSTSSGVLFPWCIFCKKSRKNLGVLKVYLVNCELDSS